MAEPRDISERFGLDYLTKSSRATKRAETSLTSGAKDERPEDETGHFDTRLEAFAGQQLLKAVVRLHDETPEGEGVRLKEVARETGMNAELLLPLDRKLTRIGLLETVEADAFGDNLVRPTEKARGIVAAGDDAQLLSELGKL